LIAQELAEKGGGLLPDEAVDFVRERLPELSKIQALRHIHRTLLKHHPEHLHVPPKRTYQRRQLQRATAKIKTKAGGMDTDDREQVNDVDKDEGDDKTEERKLQSKKPSRKATRKQQLVAIDARISKLRSDLLDAELEKEMLLRPEGDPPS
jgi:hypothetical protein